MISIYNRIKEYLRPKFKDDPMYERILIAVWDAIINLLMTNGTLVKTKGQVTIPPLMLLKTVEYGIIAFKEPTNTKAKMDFKDTFNLMNFYILDDYNMKDMRNETNE